MTIAGVSIKLWQGQGEMLRFKVDGGVGATAAMFYVAHQPNSPVAERDFVVDSTTGDILLTTSGTDLLVDVKISAAQTEDLSGGYRSFELWLTKTGLDKPATVGSLYVWGSQRN